MFDHGREGARLNVGVGMGKICKQLIEIGGVWHRSSRCFEAGKGNLGRHDPPMESLKQDMKKGAFRPPDGSIKNEAQESALMA